MRPIVIATVAGATLALIPSVANAQVEHLSVGGGIGMTGSAHATGIAYHAAVSVPVRPVGPRAHLRTELMYQTGTVNGSPFACERVDQFYCFGRTDKNEIAAAAVFVRLSTVWFGRWRFHWDPIGAGLYHRRTKSSETQGPTALCFIDGRIVGCPDNPPWATFAYRASRTSVGANIGLGLEARVARVRIFLEGRVHLPFESGESVAGAAPLTLGLNF